MITVEQLPHLIEQINHEYRKITTARKEFMAIGNKPETSGLALNLEDREKVLNTLNELKERWFEASLEKLKVALQE